MEEDIYSQGAYSYHDNNVTDEDIYNVYQNINNTIFFAGEHTDPIYYGSLHAAYNSGIRVSNELVNYSSNHSSLTPSHSHPEPMCSS